MATEVTELYRTKHSPAREAYFRSGSSPGRVIFEGKREEVVRELEISLKPTNAKALKSLHEAGEDLITLHRLEVHPARCTKNLLSTNAIENSFRNMRRKLGRVTRFRAETDQATRWLAFALTEEEKAAASSPLPAAMETMPNSETTFSNERDIPLVRRNICSADRTRFFCQNNETKLLMCLTSRSSWYRLSFDMKDQEDLITEQLSRLEERCREAGIPYTIQRQTVFEAVLQRDDHPTADQVYEAVTKSLPNVSRTTVYRVLDLLVEFELVGRLNHPGNAIRFDGKVHRHHHLVCRLCQRVFDLEHAPFDTLKMPNVKQQGFEVEDFSVQMMGLCSECAEK